MVWPLAMHSMVVDRAARQARVTTLLSELLLAGSLSTIVVAATAFALRVPIPPLTLLLAVLAQFAAVSSFHLALLTALEP